MHADVTNTFLPIMALLTTQKKSKFTRNQTILQVYIAYCDGGYLSGDNASTTIHKGTELWFRGAAILDAVLHDLATRHGLLTAKDVVLGGCSGTHKSTHFQKPG